MPNEPFIFKISKFNGKTIQYDVGHPIQQTQIRTLKRFKFRFLFTCLGQKGIAKYLNIFAAQPKVNI